MKKVVDFLETLNCPFIKFHLFEMNDYPLIKKISLTKKANYNFNGNVLSGGNFKNFLCCKRIWN